MRRCHSVLDRNRKGDTVMGCFERGMVPSGRHYIMKHAYEYARPYTDSDSAWAYAEWYDRRCRDLILGVDSFPTHSELFRGWCDSAGVVWAG